MDLACGTAKIYQTYRINNKLKQEEANENMYKKYYVVVACYIHIMKGHI